MPDAGTTYVGRVEDELGEIRVVVCDAGRTIAADARDGRRKQRSWGITYVDPKTLRRDPGGMRKRRLLNRFRGAFA